MILIETIDNDGYKHLSWYKEGDNSIGICADPPFLGQIDWLEVEKEIHNTLVDRRLIDWKAVQEQQNSITHIVNAIVKRKIIALYRQATKEA